MSLLQVYDLLVKDFRREHCVRIDLHGRKAGGMIGSAPSDVGLGLEDLTRQLREAVCSTFHERAAAYEDEVGCW